MQTKTNFPETSIRLWTPYPVKQDYPLLLTILLLATFLRFNGLNEPGLWLDEVSYTIAAQSSIIDQITNPSEALQLSFDPVLSAIPFSLSLKLGFSNYLARLPAALFGILSVAVLYRLGQTLFGNVAGLIAALLLCTSSFHILYSQEARSYAQLVFFSVASFWLFYRATSSKKLTHWLFYIIFTWAGVSSHHIMAFTIFTQAISLVVDSLREGFLQNYRIVAKDFGKVWGYFGLSVVTVFLLRLPWLGDFVTRLDKTEGGSPTLDLAGSLARLLQALTNYNFFISTIIIVLALFGLLLAFNYFPKGGVLVACWLLLSIPATEVGLWWVGQYFNERHIIWGLPAFMLAAACGAVGIGDFIRKIPLINKDEPRAGSQIKVAWFAGISLLLLPILIANLRQVQQNPIIKQSWPLGQLQEVANHIIINAHSGEGVIGIPNAQYLQFYIQPIRQDLVYIDIRSTELPAKLEGRWFIFYGAQNIPQRWPQQLNLSKFHDILVVYLPGFCKIEDCVIEAKTLLTEIAEANLDSTLANKANSMLVGLSHLQD